MNGIDITAQIEAQYIHMKQVQLREGIPLSLIHI